jgi:hypothetical protein
LETPALAFEMDAREVIAHLEKDEFWGQDLGFYDFEQDDCPWSLWVVVGQRDDNFLVVPWTGDETSKLVDNDHPDHFFLPTPVKVNYSWEEWWIDWKEYNCDCSLENEIGTIYALAGYSQWRSSAELNALKDFRMRKLLPDEAKKVTRAIGNFLK